jgi:AcrR family transcriptional regulator
MAASWTAQKIANAARHLLRTEGVEAVTMRQVAKCVGLTPMAVYRHYADRTNLLNTLADEGFDDLASRLAAVRSSGTVEEQLGKVLDVSLQHALENPHLFELMFLKPREGARRYPRDFKAGRSPTATITAELIQEGMNTGLFCQDDAWEITFEMGALLQGLIMLYLGGRTQISAARFRALCHRSFSRYLRGIRK